MVFEDANAQESVLYMLRLSEVIVRLFPEEKMIQEVSAPALFRNDLEWDDLIIAR
jgi:hypothetical protein